MSNPILVIGATGNVGRPLVALLAEQGVPAVFSNWRGFFAAPGIAPARISEFEATLAHLFEQSEWQVIRDNRGWTDWHLSGAEFESFLNEQETEMADLLRELGLLER